MMRRASASLPSALLLRSRLLAPVSPKPTPLSRTPISHLSNQPTNYPISPAPALPLAFSSHARFLSTTAHDDTHNEDSEEWEEEEQADPLIGDGGDGGGIVLSDVSWGEQALAIAHQVLLEHFGDDMALYAFKVSPKGYVYVRLDKLTHKYGCPGIEEIESFSNIYSEKLDEIAENYALEVSSPGAERLLKVPEDLSRFQDMPMRVQYLDLAEDGSAKSIEKEKEGIFLLESIEHETQHCVWKLADVKANRAKAGKGRPLSRKQKDWRLHVTFDAIRRVMLYLDFRP